MIFVCAKWQVKPENADEWLDLVEGFTEATRAEPGIWCRSAAGPYRAT